MICIDLAEAFERGQAKTKFCKFRYNYLCSPTNRVKAGFPWHNAASETRDRMNLAPAVHAAPTLTSASNA